MRYRVSGKLNTNYIQTKYAEIKMRNTKYEIRNTMSHELLEHDDIDIVTGCTIQILEM